MWRLARLIGQAKRLSRSSRGCLPAKCQGQVDLPTPLNRRAQGYKTSVHSFVPLKIKTVYVIIQVAVAEEQHNEL
jgi:hypothetical protein